MSSFNEDFNEEYGYDEVTLTRNEFAESMATVVEKMLKDAPDECVGMLIDISATLGALFMSELFDSHKNEKA